MPQFCCALSHTQPLTPPTLHPHPSHTPSRSPAHSMFYSSSASAQQYYLADVKKGQVGNAATPGGLVVSLERALTPPPRCRCVSLSSLTTARGIEQRSLVCLTITGCPSGMWTTGTRPPCHAWKLEKPSEESILMYLLNTTMIHSVPRSPLSPSPHSLLTPPTPH